MTPEIESGHVRLPHPEQAPWVLDLISEFRNFPNDVHDDQVDAMTQALLELREDQRGGVTSPNRTRAQTAGALAGSYRLGSVRSERRRV